MFCWSCCDVHSAAWARSVCRLPIQEVPIHTLAVSLYRLMVCKSNRLMFAIVLRDVWFVERRMCEPNSDDKIRSMNRWWNTSGWISRKPIVSPRISSQSSMLLFREDISLSPYSWFIIVGAVSYDVLIVTYVLCGLTEVFKSRGFSSGKLTLDVYDRLFDKCTLVYSIVKFSYSEFTWIDVLHDFVVDLSSLSSGKWTVLIDTLDRCAVLRNHELPVIRSWHEQFCCFECYFSANEDSFLTVRRTPPTCICRTGNSF